MTIRTIARLALVVVLPAIAATPPTPQEAKRFIDDAEKKLLALNVDAGRADWIKSTYITDDTEAVSALLDQKAIDATVDYAKKVHPLRRPQARSRYRP